MALPTPDREIHLVSSRGAEVFSSGALAKSSYWTVYQRYSSISLVNFEGRIFIDIRSAVQNFHLSQAIDASNNIVSDRLWLWEVTVSGELNLVEIEPFEDADPIIHRVVTLDTGVLNVRSLVIDGYPIRTMVLKIGPPSTMWLRVYTDVFAGVVALETQFPWTTTRLNNFDFEDYISENDIFSTVYPDVLSPPNIYTTNSSLSVPQFVSVTQIGNTNLVQIVWDTVTGGEDYRLERSINDPTFSSPTIIYLGPGTSYTDTLMISGATYYYRVKLVMTSALIESLWSSIDSIVITLVANFMGDPLSGFEPLTVQFTDLSVPSGMITGWEWDFGDGSPHSTLQNPVHSYLDDGVYTVTLIASTTTGDITVIKPDYILVAEANPSVTGMIYIKKRSEDDPFILEGRDFPYYGVTPDELYFGLTGLAQEVVAYRWDFGEGGESAERHPFYTYYSYGYHRVVAYVRLLSQEWRRVGDLESLIVMGVLDFEGDPTRGDKPLSVDFDNKSIAPTGTFFTGSQWDLGDTTDIIGYTGPQHLYEDYGSYDVGLDSEFNPL